MLLKWQEIAKLNFLIILYVIDNILAGIVQ